MSDALAGLDPHPLWGHFATITTIPRPSKHEERIAAWIRELAEQRGLAVRQDRTGNLVVVVPATPGRERAPVVILQGHLDMVCEKNRDVEHDFMRDPIRARVEGEWVSAQGTTLGADNGIGVAAALAVATDESVEHGPLELLFTLDEETGLTGAQGLDGSMLKGRTLLNLDSEEDGVLFVGCAGGADSHLFLEGPRGAAAEGRRAYRIEVGGLRGGHSGMDIHHNRGNALKLLTRALTALIDAGLALELASLVGGSKHNAIPREAEALVCLPPGDEARCRELLEAARERFRAELPGIDDGLGIRLAPAGKDRPAVFDESGRDRLIDLLAVLPNGVGAMSREIPGLVETSSNLAVIGPHDGSIRIVTSARSSVDSALAAVQGSVRAAGRLAGARVETHDGYPGWKPDLDSPALGVLRTIYREIWDREPRVTAVHAGLECGLLAEKVPGLDMISFGPQIEGAHSPDERVHVPSVERFWRALCRALATLGQ